MANNDEITLKLKVDSQGTNSKISDTETQISKLKKSSEETSNGIGIMDTKYGKMWNTFTSGVGKGIESLKTFKGAMMATGIGLLIAAIGTLVEYFTKSEEGAFKLKVITAALSQVMNVLTDVVSNVGETIVKAFENPQKAVKDLWNVIKENLINRVKGLINVYEDAFNIIKTGFTGVSKTIEAAFSLGAKKDKLKKEAAEAFSSMGDSAKKMANDSLTAITGVNNLIEKVTKSATAFANKITSTTETAIDLQKRQNALDVETRNNLVIEAELNVKLANARLKASDVTLTAAERIKASNEALKYQNEISNNQIRLAKEEYEITKKKNELGKTSTADLNKEAELKAKIIQLDANRVMANRLVVTQESSILKRDREQTQKELNAKLALQKNYDDELQKLKDENYVNSQKSDHLKQLAQIKVDEDNFKSDLKDKLKKGEITQEQLLELQKEGDKKFANERDKADKDDIEKRKKTDEAILQNKRAVMSETENLLTNSVKILADVFQGNKELQIAGIAIDKAAAIAKIIGQTAIANAKAVASFPITAGQPWVTINTISAAAGIAGTVAAGAKAIGEINSSNVQKKQTGGLILGNKHSEGGVLINAEGGEGMVNAVSMKNPMIAQEVLRLNNLGNSGGASTYRGSSLDEEAVSNAVIKAIKEIPVTVTEYTISKAQREVKIRQDRFTQK